MTTWICKHCNNKTCFSISGSAPLQCVIAGNHVWQETTQYEIRELEPEQPKRYRIEIPDIEISITIKQ